MLCYAIRYKNRHEYKIIFNLSCVICEQDLRSVTEAAKNKGLDVTLCATSYIPNSTVNISSETMQDAQELLNALHSHAEVMRIYTNFTEDKND